MSDLDEPWPKEMLIPKDSGFFRRALAIAASSASSLTRATMILPKPEGPMGSLGPLDDVPGAIKVDPTFKLVFLSVVGLTVLAGAAWLVAALAQPSDAASLLASGCETLTKIGFGAVVGLLGGKTPPAPSRSRRR
jgi:hypothetical protein